MFISKFSYFIFALVTCVTGCFFGESSDKPITSTETTNEVALQRLAYHVKQYPTARPHALNPMVTKRVLVGDENGQIEGFDKIVKECYENLLNERVLEGDTIVTKGKTMGIEYDLISMYQDATFKTLSLCDVSKASYSYLAVHTLQGKTETYSYTLDSLRDGESYKAKRWSKFLFSDGEFTMFEDTVEYFTTADPEYSKFHYFVDSVRYDVNINSSILGVSSIMNDSKIIRSETLEHIGYLRILIDKSVKIFNINGNEVIGRKE